jgi:hypothetical protein
VERDRSPQICMYYRRREWMALCCISLNAALE